MKFQVSSELHYEVRSKATMILNIHALRTLSQTVLEETFTVYPYIRAEEFTTDQGQNKFIRPEVPRKDPLLPLSN